MSESTPVISTRGGRTGTPAQREAAVYVGRGSVWGNPYPMRPGAEDPEDTTAGSRRDVVMRYEMHLLSRPDLLRQAASLHGRVLRCFCAPRPCHADVLAHYADALATTGELPDTTAFAAIYGRAISQEKR